MNIFRLLWQSLIYYWRTNLAVLLGVIAGTAVIGGALIVGDSVRGSLETMTRERLGEIDFVLSSHRFFTEDLIEKFDQSDPEKDSVKIAPALVMIGALERELPNAKKNANPKYARAGQVNIYGLDDRLWQMTNHGQLPRPEGDQIIVSHRLAEQLGQADETKAEPLAKGDQITLWIELPSSIPRDSLLGDRTQKNAASKTFTVAEILPEESGVGRLSLNPSQQLPLNAFVDLDALQKTLNLHAHRELGEGRFLEFPARVNAVFVSDKRHRVENLPAPFDPSFAVSQATSLTKFFKSQLTLADLSLRMVPHQKAGYLSLESEQQILSDTFADAGQEAARLVETPASPALVYIANKIANADPLKVQEKSKDQPGKGYSMYSIVAGTDAISQFAFEGERPNKLGEQDIVINEWLAEGLEVHIGEKITLSYYQVGAHILGDKGEIPEQTQTFTVRGLVKMSGPALDKGWVPDVPGITDVKTFSDIKDERFPIRKNLITKRDDQYWQNPTYNSTPKAFVSLSAAQKMWKSRYGKLTSLRIGVPQDSDIETTQAELTKWFLFHLDSQEAGLAFRPVRYEGLQAARGTTDFSGLFFGFSFFLILSATILIGLLFRLGIERRAKQIGLLSAVGYTPAQVRRLFLLEGSLVVIAGGVLGILAAVGYAHVMIYGLKTWWFGAIGTKFLDVYLTWLSIILGFAISVIITLITIWWALRQLKKLTTRELLLGEVETPLTAESQHRRGKLAKTVSLGCSGVSLVILIAAILGAIPSSEAFMGISWSVVAFFVVGIAMLTASLTFLSWLLESDRGFAVRGSGILGTGRLGVRNAARSRMRSVLTVGLIASATFVIVAVAAGHRNPAVEQPDFDSGNGGFTLVAEASTPVNYDLNTTAGREKIRALLDKAKADAMPNEETQTDEKDETQADSIWNDPLWSETKVMPFRVKPGENASCLNIYQTQLPTILGATEKMISRGGFKFIGADRENPWTLLEETLKPIPLTTPDGKTVTVPAYPVFGDMNTLQYSLHKAVGDVVAVPNESHPEAALKIVGMLDGSVFQGVLLTSEPHFEVLFPEQSGYGYFLVEAPLEKKTAVSNLLETSLHGYGLDAEPVGERLKNFLEVQNTYLSTFQALGGLGLLLGTLGLATVMLRNVLERRSELALLRAVGFVNSRLVVLVLAENAFLLLWGLLAGTASALVAMAPHLLSIGADVPWDKVLYILEAVAVVGMFSAMFAVWEAVRTPVLATLRSE